MQVQFVSSKDNPLVQRIRALGSANTAYRDLQQLWLEGEHLCSAWRHRRQAACTWVQAASAHETQRFAGLLRPGDKGVVMPDKLFDAVCGVPSSTGLGFLVPVPNGAPEHPAERPANRASLVVLDRLQDAGNVGSILRSAAALGCRAVWAVKGTAALWSPKVLRSAMGAHFALDLREGLEVDELLKLAQDASLSLVGTSSHAQQTLNAAVLPEPMAWVMGHEGQGVAERLLAACARQLRIPQPGGEESLNVAAACAVCLYESWRQAVSSPK